MGLASRGEADVHMPWSTSPPPPAQGAPKLKVAIVGGGLAGLSTAVELLDQG